MWQNISLVKRQTQESYSAVNVNSYCQNNLNAKNGKLWSFTSDFLLLYENVCIGGEINKLSYVIVMFNISFLKLKYIKIHLSFEPIFL